MPRGGWVAVGAAGAAFWLEVVHQVGVGILVPAMAALALVTLGLAARAAGRLAVPAVGEWASPPDPRRGPPSPAAGAGGAVATGTAAGATGNGATRGAAGAIAAGIVLIALRVALGGILGPDPGVPGGTIAGAPGLPIGGGPWGGTVVSIGAPLDGRQRVTLELAQPVPLLVAASLPRYPSLEPGDLVHVAGTLRRPDDSPYGAFLVRTGIAGTLRSPTLERLGSSASPAWIVERIRRGSGAALSSSLAEPEAGLAAGILVGLRDRVDRDLAAAFTTAGVSHVVAISGWNISIVAGVIAALAGNLAPRRRAGLTIGAIAAYVAFAGASPSVLRAAVMAGVVLMARQSGRSGRAPAALGWAATILLVAEPAMVRDAGFQLSTLATAGLIAWATPIAERLAGNDPGRIRRWLAESLGVSLAAQAATLPVVLVTFGRLSLAAPLVNLAVIPLVAPAMAAGAVALGAGWLVAGGLPTWVSVLAGMPAWVILGLMVAVVRAGAALPFASMELEPPWSSVVALVASLALLLPRSGLLRRWVAWAAAAVARAGGRWVAPGRGIRAQGGSRSRRVVETARPAGTRGARGAAGARGSNRAGGASRGDRARRAAALMLALGLMSAGVVVVHLPDPLTRIAMLDVGQGDAILVEGSQGGRVLIDTGPDPDRLLVLLDERLPPWDRRLDAVVITHPHEDHVAGLALLLERYEIGSVLDTGMPGPGPGDAAARAAMERNHTDHRTLRTGDRIAVDHLVLHVLWPDAGAVPERTPDSGVGINNVSVVLLGEVDGRTILLTGDAEEGVDPRLLAHGVPRLDVLKVAHHGSRTATSEELLDATRPALALISVGAENDYGHPAPATLERLRERGTRALRTDQGGTIEVTIGGGQLIARTERGGTQAVLPRMRPPETAARVVAAAGDSRSAGLPATPRGPRGLLYHRPDDRPRARGRRLPASLAGPPGLVPPSRAGRRRGGLVARRSVHAGRPARQPDRRGGSRAPPRCGQAAPTLGSCPCRGPRPGHRRLADAPGPRRAGGGRRRAPGGPPGGSGLGHDLAGAGWPRGADRGVRGQAGGPAPGIDGRAVRLVGPPLPGWLARRDPRARPPARGAAGARGVRRRWGDAGGRPPPPVDRPRDPRGAPPGALRDRSGRVRETTVWARETSRPAREPSPCDRGRKRGGWVREPSPRDGGRAPGR